MDIDSKAIYKAIEASINNAKESQRVLHDDITSVRAYNVAIHHLDWVKGEIDNLVEVAATSDQAQVRRDALVDAARAICGYCFDGVFEIVPYRGKLLAHQVDRVKELCSASAIYKLIAADQGQGGERS